MSCASIEALIRERRRRYFLGSLLNSQSNVSMVEVDLTSLKIVQSAKSQALFIEYRLKGEEKPHHCPLTLARLTEQMIKIKTKLPQNILSCAKAQGLSSQCSDLLFQAIEHCQEALNVYVALCQARTKPVHALFFAILKDHDLARERQLLAESLQESLAQFSQSGFMAKGIDDTPQGMLQLHNNCTRVAELIREAYVANVQKTILFGAEVGSGYYCQALKTMAQSLGFTDSELQSWQEDAIDALSYALCD